MIDAFQCGLGLPPEEADELRLARHGLQASSGEIADLGEARRTQLGDLVFLQASPDRFYRGQLRRMRGQEGHIERISRNGPDSNRFGLPSSLTLRWPTAPLTAASCFAHKLTLTACRDTPTSRTASACGTLRLSRRVPMPAKSRFVFTRSPRLHSSRNNARGYEMVVKRLTNAQWEQDHDAA